MTHVVSNYPTGSKLVGILGMDQSNYLIVVVVSSVM